MGHDRFGVKLDSFNGKIFVPDAHDLSLLRLRRDRSGELRSLLDVLEEGGPRR
jgi:hypothetical protein